MFFAENKIMVIVFYCMIFLSPADKFINAEVEHTLSDTTSISKSDRSQGYRDIVLFADKYIAVGTDGRIDCITKEGVKTSIDNSNTSKLNCAFSNNEIVIAAGDHGTMLYSTDGKSFSHAESGTDRNINGITSKTGLILAGADQGEILISIDGKSWRSIQTNAKGNIMSLSPGNSFIIGVTDVGEIIKSIDGITWEIKDYNKEYSGYNRYSKFWKILVTENTIVIIGTHEDGSPSILFSTLGNVWTERTPIYHDEHGLISYLTTKPNGITYNPMMDEIILACDNGELFDMPSCPKCNEYKKISEINLNALIYVDDYLMIVGDEYSFFIQKL